MVVKNIAYAQIEGLVAGSLAGLQPGASEQSGKNCIVAQAGRVSGGDCNLLKEGGVGEL